MNLKRILKTSDATSMIKYFIVGVASFLTDYLIFIFAHYFIKMPIFASGLLSFSLAFILSFIFQKNWTFKADVQINKTYLQLAQYLAVALFNMFIAAYGTLLISNLGVPPFLARPVVFGIIMVWNYLIYKKIIFK